MQLCALMQPLTASFSSRASQSLIDQLWIVPGLEADVSAVDQLADFLIEEQDVFLPHGEPQLRISDQGLISSLQWA